MCNNIVTYSFFGMLCISLFGCQENKKKVAHIQYEEINEVMDTIVAKREYVRLSSSEIIPKMEKLLSGKVKLILPKFNETDSMNRAEYLEALAVSSTYATWGQELNQLKLYDEATQRSVYLLDKLGESDLSKENSISENADSLTQFVNEFLANDTLANLNAYYEALTWLENLYITLNLDVNVRNKTEYKELLKSQLIKGDDLLEYLYDYQDYEPISEFSLAMLDILDCKNYDLRVTQLKDLIIDLRQINNHSETTK